MKLHLYISNFRNLILGVFIGLLFAFVASLIANHIIENSNHRLSKIYSSQSITESVFYIGNSRAVPFSAENLKTSKKILNLSHNSMNYLEVVNIIKAVKQKKIENKKIYIEITSLIDDNVQCQYSIFYDLKFYFGKKNIEESCSKKFYLEKIFPIAKLNNELFYRVVYYYFFPKKDQLWFNNYQMPRTVCKNPETSELMVRFFNKNAEKKIYKKSMDLLNMYSDANTEIYFFISPVYQKKNFALEMEKNLLSIGLKNLIKINTVLNEKFFKDCNMFADTLHLSIRGVSMIKESTDLTEGK
jgi:hypothetical protein